MSPADLQIAHHRLAAIAEEMGVVLCRSAFSPNIKERRDYSCAVFDAAGALVAQAAHIPVHLGSTPLSVRAAIAQRPMRDGDVVVLNDPYAGGTHLPDVTVVAPVYVRGRRAGYVANRAHHADIGGMSPGSMPLASEIYQEGLRLPPVYLARAGAIDDDVLRLFLANARVAAERRGDLLAQVAALRVGAERLGELVTRTGAAGARRAMAALQEYSERVTRAALRALPRGTWRARDRLDDDGLGARDIPIVVTVRLGGGRALVDFAGSGAQVRGGVNANYAVTLAAVYYVFRTLIARDVPTNAGFMRPIAVRAPEGSIVNATFPAAVAGGNVETSQRIVDVLFAALARALPQRIPAASGGTMNNLAFGGTWRPRGAPAARQFSYYETIGGGAGAGPRGAGCDAVHTHMTNTLNTPIEALEAELPVRVVRYAIRRRSGGRGRHRGGDGIVRELEFLAPAQVTLLGERRRARPPGGAGGAAGAAGRDELARGAAVRALPAKGAVAVQPGDRIRVSTPGGGGWGAPRRRRRVRGESS
ncbi:hydantoinase B/oxoprolinase family protein [bacterium]|nr:hydantoinase B/oxoprolinase family protein [bacterium]